MILLFVIKGNLYCMNLRANYTHGGADMNPKDKKKETIIVDPFGSYTGKPMDSHEKPIQDADDL